MTILNILQYPAAEKQLRAECTPIPTETIDGVERLVVEEALYAKCNDLVETMLHYRGAGLAAPQVGWPVRVVTFVIGMGQPMVVVNPEVLVKSGKHVANEGCLSFGSVQWPIAAPTKITVRGVWATLDRDGMLEGFDRPPSEHTFDGTTIPEDDDRLSMLAQLDRFRARVLSHEIEHVSTPRVLLPDRMSSWQRKMFLKAVAKATGAS